MTAPDRIWVDRTGRHIVDEVLRQDTDVSYLLATPARENVGELVEALRKASRRIEWCAGLLPSEDARDRAFEWAEELEALLASIEQEKKP